MGMHLVWVVLATASPSKEKAYWCDFSSVAAALVAAYASFQICLNLAGSFMLKYG